MESARHGDDRIVAEDRVAVRNPNVDGALSVLRREVEIVVEELAPGVHHAGKILRHRDRRVALADDDVRDVAGVEIGEAKAVVADEMGFSETNEISAGSILVRVAEVNACAIDGPISHENLLPLCVSFAPCVSPS